jgi:hypothetical protein
LALVLALSLTLAACHHARDRIAGPSHAPTQAWTETDRFVGLGRPGGEVTPGEWQAFVNGVITPRFPDGFTVFSADGQYRASDGRIVREPCRVLLLLYPESSRADADRLISEIATQYAARFDQESVLRSDGARSVEFIARPSGAAASAKE